MYKCSCLVEIGILALTVESLFFVGQYFCEFLRTAGSNLHISTNKF